MREWLGMLVLPFLLLFPEASRAQWTSVTLPKSLSGVTIQTTAPVNARCVSVVISEGSRSCGDSSTPPTFNVGQSEIEVLQTLPAGSTLTLLEVQRDPDGYAVRVQNSEGMSFWIFESSTNSSSQLGSENLNQLLGNVAVAEAVTAVGDITVVSTTPSIPPPCDCEQPQKAQTHIPQVPTFGSVTDSGVGFHDMCSSFITNTGEYGPYGNILLRELRAPHRAGLYSSDLVFRLREMSQLCPNFPSFTDAQKERFWVWTFMSIAHVESKCGVYNEGMVPGPSGIPWGLLQMEWKGVGLDGVRSRWAGNPAPETACKAPDISADAANLACGLDAMLSYVSGFHICERREYSDRPPELIDPESCTVPLSGIYWQKMRPMNGSITRRIKSFEACGAHL